MNDVIHTIPLNDLIEHDTNDDNCVCGPEVVLFERWDGSYGFQVFHHSLRWDGSYGFHVLHHCPLYWMTTNG
jgi:hypothetical protein